MGRHEEEKESRVVLFYFDVLYHVEINRLYHGGHLHGDVQICQHPIHEPIKNDFNNKLNNNIIK